MRTVVLASNFYGKKNGVLREREWVKVGWMMSIDEESVVSVQFARSFLFPSFPFFFISILSSSFFFLLLSITFVSFQSLTIPFFSLALALARLLALFESTLCIHLDHINVIIIIHCKCLCEQHVRKKRRERRKRIKESFTLSLQLQKHLCMNRRGGVAQALLTVQSARTYYTHFLMDFVYYYQLHWMTVNLLVRIWVHIQEKKRTDLITPSNSRQSCSNKGIRSIYTKKEDSIGVTSFTQRSLTRSPSLFLFYATKAYVFVYTNKITPFVIQMVRTRPRDKTRQ